MCSLNFCTIAVGEKYVELSSETFNKLNETCNALVLTDASSKFRCPTIEYEDDGTHIWQQKRHVLKAALEIYPNVIFIDADYHFKRNPTVINFTEDPLISWNVMPMVANTVNWHSTLIPVMEGLSDVLNLSDWTKSLWVGPNMYRLQRDPNIQVFFEAWETIAFYLKEHHYKINDGVSLGLAALKAGWVPKGIREAFKPLEQELEHKYYGTWADDGTMT